MGLLSFLSEILFVGHSLVGPSLPPLTEASLRAMNEPARVEAQIINGAPLSYNWDHAAEAEGVNARERLGVKGVDALILTEAQPFPDHVKYSDTAGQVVAWAKLARQKNPGGRVFLYETWPSRRSGPGMENKDDPYSATPWRDRISGELALWQGVVSAAAEAGQEVVLIPAGQAMLALDDAIAAGAVPGIDSLDQMFSDDIHLSGKGLYFVAMVHAAAITGRSPEGVPAKLTRAWTDRDAVIGEDTALALQRVAWATVQGYVPGKGAGVPAPAPVAAPEAAPQPVAAMPAIAMDPVSNPNLALGLSGVHDWSVQQPFLDVFKTAREWTGHLPGQWGGWSHDDLARAGVLDANGWPTALPSEVTGIATLILTDLPADAAGVAGRYLVRWQGEGVLEAGGRAQDVRFGPNSLSFDFTPGDSGVILTLTRINPADPIRNITVVREDRAAALDGGQIFNPDWLGRIRGVKMIRFMDWMATNNSLVTTPADRPRVDDFTWSRKGVPMEVMLALANELGADPWFTLPHLADDALVAELAGLAHQGLQPGLRPWVEYSNEVWNWQFAQAQYAEAQGRALWGADGLWLEFYAHRARQVADIWAGVFADNPDRLVRVIGVQTGALGMEQMILNPTHALAMDPRPIADSFDAYAVTGYVAALLGFEEKQPMVKDWLAQSRAADPANPHALAFGLALQELRDGSLSGKAEDTLSTLISQTLPYHAALAADRGLRLVMYEGGSHVVGIGPVVEDPEIEAFFTALNYSPEMGALYAELLAGWAMISDAPFNAFVDVARPGKWGSWGALRHLGDDSPRWQALRTGP